MKTSDHMGNLPCSCSAPFIRTRWGIGVRAGRIEDSLCLILIALLLY